MGHSVLPSNGNLWGLPSHCCRRYNFHSAWVSQEGLIPSRVLFRDVCQIQPSVGMLVCVEGEGSVVLILFVWFFAEILCEDATRGELPMTSQLQDE